MLLDPRFDYSQLDSGYSKGKCQEKRKVVLIRKLEQPDRYARGDSEEYAAQ